MRLIARHTLNTISLMLFSVVLLSYSVQASQIRVAVYPFIELPQENYNLEVSYFIQHSLSKYEFIKTIPVDMIREKTYEIDPVYMWTGQEGSERQGGIAWSIRQETILEVSRTFSAEYSVYGLITRYGDEWELDSFISRGSRSVPEVTFSAEGTKGSDLTEKLKEAASSLAGWLESEFVVESAEDTVRRYRGGLTPYKDAILYLKSNTSKYPHSFPLHAMLLDLYLEDDKTYQAEIISTGMKIVNSLKMRNDGDIRYVLALNLDPYDAVAGIYEDKRDWESAIPLRTKAIEIFPANRDRHIDALGKDYLSYAVELESGGKSSDAVKVYKSALTYFSPSSEGYKRALDSIKMLTGKQ